MAKFFVGGWLHGLRDASGYQSSHPITNPRQNLLSFYTETNVMPQRLIQRVAKIRHGLHKGAVQVKKKSVRFR